MASCWESLSNQDLILLTDNGLLCAMYTNRFEPYLLLSHAQCEITQLRA